MVRSRYICHNLNKHKFIINELIEIKIKGSTYEYLHTATLGLITLTNLFFTIYLYNTNCNELYFHIHIPRYVVYTLCK